MIEIIEKIIGHIGPSNALAIILFSISLFVAFFLYFKAFYRLVYSATRICKGCAKITDWTNNETKFVTRILFYNNGRKIITRNEIQKLEVKSSKKIDSVKTIKGNETIRAITNRKQNIVNIDIEYLDSSEFFVLEINHSGILHVNGRISETGRLLNTEPKWWLVLNIVLTIFFFVMMFYNLRKVSGKEDPFTLELITNMFIIFGIFNVIRFIHSILFIPNSLSSKYLNTKDKFANGFENLQ